jgi:hypothetical protein
VQPFSCCALCAFALQSLLLQGAAVASREAQRQACIARHIVRVLASAACLGTRRQRACIVLKGGLRGAVSAHGADRTLCAHGRQPRRALAARQGSPVGRSHRVRVLLRRRGHVRGFVTPRRWRSWSGCTTAARPTSMSPRCRARSTRCRTLPCTSRTSPSRCAAGRGSGKVRSGALWRAGEWRAGGWRAGEWRAGE